MLLYLIDFVSHKATAHAGAEAVAINIQDVRMLKMGLFYWIRILRWAIDFAGKIETRETGFFKDTGPLCRFQRNAICSGKPGRDEADIMVFVAR
jgi:hypothetical protein